MVRGTEHLLDVESETKLRAVTVGVVRMDGSDDALAAAMGPTDKGLCAFPTWKRPMKSAFLRSHATGRMRDR